jgi:cytochrome P450
LYHLSKNPEKQQKLYEETKKMLPNSRDESLTAEKLESMKYLKACIKESMRYVPHTNEGLKIDCFFQGSFRVSGQKILCWYGTRASLQ